TLPLPPTSRRGRRQRRPSGSAPPLPRCLGPSGKVWLTVAVLAIANLIWLPIASQPQTGIQLENNILRFFADLRASSVTTVMGVINTAGSLWGPTVLGWATVAALVVFRRWRHLFTFLGALMVLSAAGSTIYQEVARPRPYGVRIVGDWGGFSMPSPPVAAITTVLMGIAYTVVVPGRARTYAKFAIAALVAVFAFSRLYLGVDHPSDIAYGVILGVSIPLVAFRLFTPNEAFPVVYRRGKKAHLDVGGERGRAIREAVEQQLGLEVLEIKPVGLEGSGGSTPLRLRVAGDPDTYVFAKLYAKSHVMADRWYKLGRSLLYGALEDEAPFQTVRRFVESEDYNFRLLRDACIPTAAPYGIVEITPEREYLIVTEFLQGAQEIGDAEVDDTVIDNGLELVRQLWDAGLAHRDVKPANLLVRDGTVYLIDAFFVQVRPSPWRQAVDLANMMLVLAVRSTSGRVYERALQWFTPDEIAEAFAATRGVASPTQLRAAMKRDGRDLLAEFRALAPERSPIGIQRWSVRRVVTALVVVALFIAATGQTINLFSNVRNLPVQRSPECGTSTPVILMAQAVPSASQIPCIAALPSGWEFGSESALNGKAEFSLSSDLSGHRAVVVTLRESCDVRGLRPISTDEVDTERFEAPVTAARAPLVRTYVFPGGCATYRFSVTAAETPDEVFFAERALAFTPRNRLVEHVRQQQDLTLCGRGTSCPG
ncbi:MAG: hypothetical protein ACRD2W_17120, partial [Acidimicrobiales bacterium]